MGVGFGDVLNLLGSLGLFLVGMKLMSDALMTLAGNRMRRIMAGLTSNRFVAALTGLFITGLIQSSSATTLMVVSFVNAGLLQLTEALGVIMGANIGTTLTAWLIAVLGFKVSMVDIALPMMIVGFAFYMREDKQAATFGGFVIGFSLLFIGLEFMKDAIPDLQSNPALFEAIERMAGFGTWSLLLFALLGTVLTLVLQSSSATMAITLVAVSQGWLPFDAACAIVLGENIGTTITANLAAVVAGANARRAALAHLMFNVIGVTWVLILFRPFLDVVSTVAQALQGVSPLTDPADAPIGLAIFHTVFNVTNTTLLIGFIGPLARLVTTLLPESESPEARVTGARYLDDAVLRYPQTAIAAGMREIRHLYREPVLESVLSGLRLPVRELPADSDLRALVAGSRRSPGAAVPDIEANRVRPVYEDLVSFIARVHQRHALEDAEERQLRNIGFASRDALMILADVGQLAQEMGPLWQHANAQVRAACDEQRLAILGLLVQLQALDFSLPHQDVEAELKAVRRQLESEDHARIADINQLLQRRAVRPDAAAALLGSSALVRSLGRNLVRAARHISAAMQVPGVPSEGLEAVS